MNGATWKNRLSGWIERRRVRRKRSGVILKIIEKIEEE